MSDVCVYTVHRVFPKTRIPRARLINRRRTTMAARVSGNKTGRLPGKSTRLNRFTTGLRVASHIQVVWRKCVEIERTKTVLNFEYFRCVGGLQRYWGGPNVYGPRGLLIRRRTLKIRIGRKHLNTVACQIIFSKEAKFLY